MMVLTAIVIGAIIWDLMLTTYIKTVRNELEEQAKEIEDRQKELEEYTQIMVDSVADKSNEALRISSNVNNFIWGRFHEQEKKETD